MGVSVARNNGIKLAHFDWLLFLDADDWLLPQHLEQLVHVLEADPNLDSAYCGWTYVTPDGPCFCKQFGGSVGDLFSAHAQYCFSIIHTYLVPRSLVNAVGGFDPSFRTCEDWDLFQRIARTGARFGGVPEILAAYRMRADSATTNGYQRFADGIRVLTQGHAPDPRVLAPHPVYPNGLPKHELAKHKFGLACACAGYVIGNGGDARSLLDVLKNERHPSMDPYEVAAGIIIHALVSASRPQTDWYKLWPSLKRNIKEFLIALEEHSGTGVTSRARL